MTKDVCVIPEGKLPGVSHVSYYAVYDGHGGTEAAEYLEKVLYEEILSNVFEMPNDVEGAMRKAFADVDALLVEKLGSDGLSVGSTAVVCLILDRTLYTANVGDAEACLGRRDASQSEYAKPLELTHIHKISSADEKERVETCGGKIFMGRLFGTLAISRAFGDGEMKRPKQPENYVSVEPFVKRVELTPDDDFIILACDGLWDKLTHEEASLFVSKLLHYKTLDDACQFLMDEAMDRNTKDNVTIIVASLGWSIPLGHSAGGAFLESLPDGFRSFLKSSELLVDESEFERSGVRDRIASPQIKVTSAKRDFYIREDKETVSSEEASKSPEKEKEEEEELESGKSAEEVSRDEEMKSEEEKSAEKSAEKEARSEEEDSGKSAEKGSEKQDESEEENQAMDDEKSAEKGSEMQDEKSANSEEEEKQAMEQDCEKGAEEEARSEEQEQQSDSEEQDSERSAEDVSEKLEHSAKREEQEKQPMEQNVSGDKSAEEVSKSSEKPEEQSMKSEEQERASVEKQVISEEHEEPPIDNEAQVCEKSAEPGSEKECEKGGAEEPDDYGSDDTILQAPGEF